MKRKCFRRLPSTAAAAPATRGKMGTGSPRAVSRRACPQFFGDGAFTLVEILVVLSIISILVALALPAFVKARELARSVNCKSNLHQIGIALDTYRQNWHSLPPGRSTNLISRPGGRIGLGYLVPGDLADCSVLYCPSASKIRLGEASVDAELIGKVHARCSYLYRGKGLVSDYNGPDNLNHKGRIVNVLYEDGRVESVPR